MRIDAVMIYPRCLENTRRIDAVTLLQETGADHHLELYDILCRWYREPCKLFDRYVRSQTDSATSEAA